MVMRLSVLAAGLLGGLIVSHPASAQGLSVWGMWGKDGYASTRRSYLGVRPVPHRRPSVALKSGGPRPQISPEAPPIVAFASDFELGSIVIDTARRRLFYVLSENDAYSYPIAVGKRGFSWTGVEQVSKVVDWPDWIPPSEMRARQPSLPLRMTGGVRNPLGVKAIYLGKTLYRIHGTNDARSIGSASSSGCFRMHNAQVVHLAGLVSPDTTVYVLKRLPKEFFVKAPAYVPRPVPARRRT
jgi:lipoprotein-anchoring transpeptidase ErfK/SrfK